MLLYSLAARRDTTNSKGGIFVLVCIKRHRFQPAAWHAYTSMLASNCVSRQLLQAGTLHYLCSSSQRDHNKELPFLKN